MIAKGERDELRRVVRGDFKALGKELHVRRAELIAEIERRVAERFRAHERAIGGLDLRVHEIVGQANLALSQAVAEVAAQASGYELRWTPLAPPPLQWVREKRDELRRAMIADLDARIAHAESVMARQENDLLKRLSVDALESEAAHAFLGEIPAVAALVPSSRLAELEAQFDADPDVFKPPEDPERDWRRRMGL